MEDFAELMQRLLKVQSGGRQRSLELVAEDERLMDALRKRDSAGKTPPNHDSISEMGILRLLNGPVIVKGQTVKQPNSLTDPLDKTTVVIEVVTTFSSFQVS